MKSFFFTKKITDWGKWGYVEVKAENSIEAREKMIKEFGLQWGFEYNELEKIHPLDRTFITIIE